MLDITYQASDQLSRTNPHGLAIERQRQTASENLAEQKRQFDIKTASYNDWLGRQQASVGSLDNMLSAYNQAYTQAKGQNEAKYQQMLGLADTNSGQQRMDAIRNWQQQRADSMQGLARTGMSNTTIAPTLQAGIQREQQEALNNIADQLARTKLGVMQGYNYQGPDSGIMQSLIQALIPQKNFSF